MTPAEEYAQKRAEAVALIETHAPQRLQQSLIDLLRPAIALNVARCDDDEIPIGASKFGGAPDVPANFEWPTWNDKPLGFLAQVNLEEVAPFDVENALPKSGLLSFFIECDEEQNTYAYCDEADSWRVFWFDKEPLQSTKILREVSWKIARIKSEAAWTFSVDVTPDFDFSLPDEEAQWDNYLDEIPLQHHMFGYPNEIQGLAAEECEVASKGLRFYSVESYAMYEGIDNNFADWKLLLQVDSDDEINANWGDWGRLFFMIRSQDLAARDFAKVGFSFQSH